MCSRSGWIKTRSRIARFTLATVCAAAVVFLASSLVGCDFEPPVTEQTRAELEALPHVDVSRLSSSVTAQLERERERLDALLGATRISAHRLGQALGDMGKLYHAYALTEVAAVCYRNAARLVPHQGEWLYYQGHVQRKRYDPEAAAIAFLSFLQQEPDYLPARLWLASAYLELNREDDAEKLVRQILARNADNALAHYLMGQLAARRQDYRGAVDHYEAVLRGQPDASIVHYPLALAYTRLGEREKAHQHLQHRGARRPSLDDPLLRAIQDLQAGPQVALVRGSKALSEGNWPQAVASFRTAVEAAPEDGSMRLRLGIALAKDGQVPEALHALQRALRFGMPPSHRALAHATLADLYIGEDSPARAEEHRRQAQSWREKGGQQGRSKD